MNKSNKIIKVVSASLIAIASLVMVILAIVNLATNKNTASVIVAFRIIAGVLLILASVLSTFVVVSKDPKHFDVKLVVYNGFLLGSGIFVLLERADVIADTIVGWLIPCLLIGLGAFFIVATIISLVNKINKRGTDIFAMIIGALMVVVGTVLLCFAKDVVKVMWLIIGVLLLIYSIFALVAALKKDKNVIDEEPKEIK